MTDLPHSYFIIYATNGIKKNIGLFFFNKNYDVGFRMNSCFIGHNVPFWTDLQVDSRNFNLFYTDVYFIT